MFFCVLFSAGGRLFSKLHKLRNEKGKEHPECFTSRQHNVKLKTSHTSPSINTDHRQQDRRTAVIPEKLSDESPDADFPISWDETQQRLESCGTHSYIEETGCLQNTRSAASFYTKLDRLTLLSGPTRTQVKTHIHPPAPSLCLHSSETQEKPALPLSCTRVSQALDVMSGLREKNAGMGLIECSSDFEVAWKAADPVHNCEKINPYAMTDDDLALERTAPRTNQDLLINKAGSPNGENNLSSSPAILHLPLHCQTQIHGRASWEMNGSPQGSVLSGNSAEINTKQERSSPTVEERNGMVVIRSTDRAVFSEHTDAQITSDSSWPSSASFCHNITEKRHVFSRVPLALSGVAYKGDACSSEGKGVEEACELLSSEEKRVPPTERPSVGWFSSGSHGAPPNRKREAVDGFLKPERQADQREDQIIEVDGWCHLPRFPVNSSRPADKATQTCWGIPENEVRVWGAQILLALESLHQQGILCRDLNPRNVLLTSNGESPIIERLWRKLISVRV